MRPLITFSQMTQTRRSSSEDHLRKASTSCNTASFSSSGTCLFNGTNDQNVFRVLAQWDKYRFAFSEKALLILRSPGHAAWFHRWSHSLESSVGFPTQPSSSIIRRGFERRASVPHRVSLEIEQPPRPRSALYLIVAIDIQSLLLSYDTPASQADGQGKAKRSA